MNFTEEIFRHADPGAPALLWSGGRMTYGELEEKSRVVAKVLRNTIPSPSARIGLLCPDGRHHVVLALGILRSGHCLVPIASSLPHAERMAIADGISLSAVMVPDGRMACGFRLEPGGRPDPVLDSRFEGREPAFVRFSSGTTGSSKGILLTHTSLADRVAAANGALGITASDRILWTLPMSHHFVVSILLYLRNGAAIVLPESLLPGDLLKAALEHSSTVFYAAPFHYLLLVSGTPPPPSPTHRPWPSLRLAVSTTAPLDETISRRFASIYGVTPAQALGVMEAGLPLLNLPHPERHPLSVGRPQPGFEAEIRDDEGLPCPAGTTGQLFLRGPGMFDAYVVPWRDRSEATAPGGWFTTGDVAVTDEEGFVTLKGRISSVISVGGMKFFPEEVEEVLRGHPSVAEARVFAKDHPALGSRAVAEVVLSQGTEITPRELIDSCKAKLAPFKVPAMIRVVTSLPKTASGKIRRAIP